MSKHVDIRHIKSHYDQKHKFQNILAATKLICYMYEIVLGKYYTSTEYVFYPFPELLIYIITIPPMGVPIPLGGEEEKLNESIHVTLSK